MIELNLLPKELRKEKKQPMEMPRISFLPVCVGVVLLLLSAHLLLFFTVSGKKNQLKTLKAKWAEIQPQKEETEKVQTQITELEKRVISVRKIAKPDLEWSRLLSGLNRAMIANVWLFDLELNSDAEKGATGNTPTSMGIKGYALGGSEEATSVVAKFINSLKKNADFADFFEEVELENMSNHQISGHEVMEFDLTCRSKSVEPVPAPVKKDEKKAKKDGKKK